ncbi:MULTISPECIES: cyclic-di-AMP receptor [Lactobacillaceae]|uniref:cyclic-di-AMP receptor n=1 Tax=Lactobacillaceae TaxID=33958 RepID=UPI000C1B79FA|nr:MULTISPECIES: cyclic-di-AMP receptor [Lactobacillaceae]
MKVILAIVQDKDSQDLQKGLVDGGFRSTKLNTTGNFLRSGNTTFIIGVEEDQVEPALDVIRDNCHTRTQFVTSSFILPEDAINSSVEVQVGGATCFVLPVDKFVRF